MKVKCEYCGAYIDSSNERCPSCGAVNSNHQRTANDTPKTIEELKAWYTAHNLPPENVTRFFIGKNIKEPRAFGIYKENGKFIVYKNKDTGARAVRYEGTDEAYAVNELYLKLKSEILNQKTRNVNAKAGGYSSSYSGLIKDASSVYRSGSNISNFFSNHPILATAMVFIITIFVGILQALTMFIHKALLSAFIAILVTVLSFFILRFYYKLKKEEPDFYIEIKTRHSIKVVSKLFVVFIVTFVLSLPFSNSFYTSKYYEYDGNIYCNYQGSYYEYDGYGDYTPINTYDLPPVMVNNLGDYEWSKSYTWDENFVEFTDSSYYDDNFNTSSGDSDSSWSSSDSWDSGGTDWSSDW